MQTSEPFNFFPPNQNETFAVERLNNANDVVRHPIGRETFS